MVGWLSGFRAQTGSVAYWRNATFVRGLGEAAEHGGGECGLCPEFASNTLAFALQLRKIMENLSQGNRMASRLFSLERDSFSRLGRRGRWPRLVCCPLRPLAFDGVQFPMFESSGSNIT